MRWCRFNPAAIVTIHHSFCSAFPTRDLAKEVFNQGARLSNPSVERYPHHLMLTDAWQNLAGALASYTTQIEGIEVAVSTFRVILSEGSIPSMKSFLSLAPGALLPVIREVYGSPTVKIFERAISGRARKLPSLSPYISLVVTERYKACLNRLSAKRFVTKCLSIGEHARRRCPWESAPQSESAQSSKTAKRCSGQCTGRLYDPK